MKKNYKKNNFPSAMPIFMDIPEVYSKESGSDSISLSDLETLFKNSPDILQKIKTNIISKNDKKKLEYIKVRLELLFLYKERQNIEYKIAGLENKEMNNDYGASLDDDEFDKLTELINKLANQSGKSLSVEEIKKYLAIV